MLFSRWRFSWLVRFLNAVRNRSIEFQDEEQEFCEGLEYVQIMGIMCDVMSLVFMVSKKWEAGGDEFCYLDAIGW